MIVTQKHADLLNGGLIRKSLVPFFRRTYAFSVGFKMKPLRKNVFQCEDKNQLKFCLKACWKVQPFVFTIHLMNQLFQTSVLFNGSFIKRQTKGTSSGNKWQQMTTSDNEWYNERQRMTTGDNEWQQVVQRMTTSDNEWQRVTTNGNELQQMAMSDSEWQQVVQQMKTAQYTSKNGWLLSFLWQKQIQGTDCCNYSG